MSGMSYPIIYGKLITIKEYTKHCFPCHMENSWRIVMSMESLQSPQPKKKRGPSRRLPVMVDTHLYVPPDLLEWAKGQPEGFAPLVRRLLTAERDRVERVARRS